MNTIGMIEVFSLVNAITIADECLKTANVNLIGIENVSSGIVTVKITGDVGAVTSSVNSVKNMEKVVYHSVIPSIDEQALNILKNTKRNVLKSNKNTKKETSFELNTEQKNLQIKENIEMEKGISMEKNIGIKSAQNESGFSENPEIIKSEENLIQDGLEQKTVKELVEMVVKLKHLSYKDAKRMKKDELIERLRSEN